MLELERLDIIGLEDPTAENRIAAQLRALLLSTVSTIPGSRGFGLEGEYLDAPSVAVPGVLAVELAEACDRWIPDVAILSLGITSVDPGTGSMGIAVEAEWRGTA